MDIIILSFIIGISYSILSGLLIFSFYEDKVKILKSDIDKLKRDIEYANTLNVLYHEQLWRIRHQEVPDNQEDQSCILENLPYSAEILKS